MNYPIQGDQLTVEMLQGLYPFGGYDTLYRFIHDLNQYDVFDNEADLNEYFIGWLEFDMQNRDDDDDDDDEYNIHHLSDDIQNQAKMFKQRRFFRDNIHQDLITAAMHPNRIQKQIDQFDDIEAYFDAIGC
jgi:hypothetical protein